MTYADTQRIIQLQRALRDLSEAVDAACDFDSMAEEMWPDHLRSALELPLQRARETLAAR